MAEKKRRGRRAYLRDFKPTADGKYRYCGKYMAFDGDEREYRTFKIKTAILCTGVMLLTVLPECLPSVPMSRYPLTAVFWGLLMIAASLTFYAAGRMLMEKNPMKKYVYEASASRVRLRALLTAIFAAASFAEETIWLIINGLQENVWFNIVRPATALACACLAALFFFTVKKQNWIEKENREVNPLH